ncbi:MAG: type II secretion system F family protein, partial [Planctomycetota bacterium]
MAIYEYTAVNEHGKQSVGVVNAANRSAAIDLVVGKGLSPVDVSERGAGGNGSGAKGVAPSGGLVGGDRVPSSAVESFVHELANLLTAGVSLARALEILSRESSNASAKKQWAELRADVMDGASLADAMSRFPRSFTPVNVAMVRAGETGGFLGAVLDQIADFQEREKELRGRVKGAMIYPVILLVIMVGVMIFMMTYFIPRFTVLFEDLGGALPPLTQAIVAISDGLVEYGLYGLGVLILMVVLLRRALETETGQRRYERLMLKAPGFGLVMSRFALVRFCRMLGTLVGAGVPLVDSLNVAREAIGNRTLSDA